MRKSGLWARPPPRFRLVAGWVLDERIPSRAPGLVSIRLGLKHRIGRPAELLFPLGSVALRSEYGQAASAGCQSVPRRASLPLSLLTG